MAAPLFAPVNNDWSENDEANLVGNRHSDGEAPRRFRTSADAPWGSGAYPLIKVLFEALERKHCV